MGRESWKHLINIHAAVINVNNPCWPLRFFLSWGFRARLLGNCPSSSTQQHTCKKMKSLVKNNPLLRTFRHMHLIYIYGTKISKEGHSSKSHLYFHSLRLSSLCVASSDFIKKTWSSLLLLILRCSVILNTGGFEGELPQTAGIKKREWSGLCNVR